jgi:ATP-dependent Lhr-like helicase
VFKRVLARESLSVGWRQLAMTYRRLEARGEIRGGRFVNGMSGEQFALAEAVGQLRAIRREGPRGQLISISAADPLNLVGVVTRGAGTGAPTEPDCLRGRRAAGGPGERDHSPAGGISE